MAQYQRIKRGLKPDTLLLFRLGDFYEMFYDDAKIGSQILDIALTQRNGVPMCGIPHHAAEGYMARLVKAGRKLALCEQMEEPGPGKKLVDRAVTHILSPGTVVDPLLLDSAKNNFLAVIHRGQCREGRQLVDGYGLALVDLTTGDFQISELFSREALFTELVRTQPAEIVLPACMAGEINQGDVGNGAISLCEDWLFEYEIALQNLLDHFKTQSLDGFGAKDLRAGVGAAGAALQYLKETLKRDVSHLTRVTTYTPGDFMVLDVASQRHLEILEPAMGDRGAKEMTLLGAVDRTLTPMGGRLVREWLTHPLQELKSIQARQDAVAEWLANHDRLMDFRELLKNVRDLERTIHRLSAGHGNARDLLALKNSLLAIKPLKEKIEEVSTSLLSGLRNELVELPEVTDLIERTIDENAPAGLKEGNLIKTGYHQELDELRQAGTHGKEWIAALQQKEIERTGIKNLKVGYNSVFGYFLEVTKTNLGQVPPEWIRKQTIANGERFITPELKTWESKVLGAEERAQKLEYELFQDIRNQVVRHTSTIQAISRAIAQLDVLASFAEVARYHQYVRPEMLSSTIIQIVDGRHPVLDQRPMDGKFVPNDTYLDSNENRVAIITGPNMAGKSTYIRQVALLVLLAHTGSFIPAGSARIGLIDRIFTRVGASDDLSRGQSTFMLEMNETANILNHATQRSLIVLDEIGRGTSTFDGLSLAWAIAEHIHNEIKACTLFATHYHELTDLTRTCPGVKNYNVAVREWSDQIIFLRKIIAGGADKSYGLHVARLAGIPKPVLNRAKEILQNLENSELTPEGEPKLARRAKSAKNIKESPQLFLFQGGSTAKGTAETQK